VSRPRWDDEEPFEEDPRPQLPRSTRYVRVEDDLPTPVREVLEREPRYHGYQPRSEREKRRFRWGPVLAALVAGIVIAITFGPRRSADPAREQELASAESELQRARDRVSAMESELAATQGGVGKADASAQRAPEPVAATVPEPVTVTVAEPEAAPPEKPGRTELTPEEVLRLPAPSAEPAGEAEPEAAAPPAPAMPVADPSPEPSRSEPSQIALAEPEGSISIYSDPDPASPIVRSRAPGVVAPEVLAPERVGWTTEAQPTLYWHAMAGARSPGEFTLTREGESEPLVRGKLFPPDGAGIQRLELSQSDIALEEGVSYRWTISFADPQSGGADRATGGIRRVARPAPIGAATVTERLDAMERAGLWYDALDLVMRSVENNSGARNLVARRRAMLARVGISLP
jgi:hypothetical protein